jgi:hypothetical protein
LSPSSLNRAIQNENFLKAKEIFMGKYFFMRPVLQLISVGQFFRKAFVVFLQILAVVIAIAGLVSWITAWKFVAGQDTSLILGIIIFQVFFVIAVYMVVHTIFIRADDISTLPEADYTVIPIVSIALKLCGEIYACFSVVVAIAGGILVWFIGGNAFYFIRKSSFFMPGQAFGFMPGQGFGGYNSDFLGGLMFMVVGWLVAFLVLVIFYLFAEIVVVITDIAKNIKITREVAEQYIKE